MSDSFRSAMTDAARLIRGGDLQRATAAIQAALAASGAHPSAAANASNFKADAPLPGMARAAPTPDDDVRFTAGTHREASGQRDYKLFVPAGHGGRPLPLVVMLHGCTQDPDDFARGTRMNEAASELGFIVLYPAQAQQANPSRCWNWFKHNHQERGRGEPQVIAGMTRDVMKRHDVDARRVYVAGLSAGGAMAAILGDAYPDLYAAIGVHSGLPAKCARDLPGALEAMRSGAATASRAPLPPTIVFHGDQDTVVHPANADRMLAASTWATRDDDCAVSANGRRYTRACLRDAQGRVVAEHWLVHGAGHAWSGGDARGSYTDPKGPDATAQLVRFFLANPRAVG